MNRIWLQAETFFNTRFGGLVLGCVMLVIVTGIWAHYFHKNPAPPQTAELYNAQKLVTPGPLDYYRQAEKFMKARRYQKAADYFASAANMSPYLPEAFTGRARALYLNCDSKGYTQALKQLETAAASDTRVAELTIKLKAELKNVTPRCAR